MDYRNVTVNAADMKEMLKASKGRRDVPVILKGGSVAIGWEGKT